MRRGLLAASAAAVLTLVGWGASVALAGDEVPEGVRAGGVSLAGASRAEAELLVQRAFADEAKATVQLRAAEKVLTLDPAAAGLSLDAAAVVDDALSVGPLDRLRALLGARRSLQPRAAVDETTLQAALARLAPQVDRRPQEGAVRFSREAVPVPVYPAEGRALDVSAAAEEVRSSYLRSAEPIDLPVTVTPVRSTRAAVDRALMEVATPAVAADVVVDVSGKPLVVRRADIAAALRVESDAAGALAPQLAADRLLAAVGSRVRRVEQPPVDATFDTRTGTPVVVPSRDGLRLPAADLQAAVSSVLTAPAPRRATASLQVARPRVTTERARTLGVREVISTFTTHHPCCRPRVRNIQLIADIVDGHVVLPQEIFDLNATVGPRDRARGFVPAPQILRGQFVDDVGGGVSQFATTLFNAVFFAGLRDIEHTPHSYYISRYPPGREATVSFPKPDLRFQNDGGTGVLIRTSHTPTSITVTFWGTKRWSEVRALAGPRTRFRSFGTEYVDRADCTATQGERGFDIVVWRIFELDGREVRRERFFTRYKPEPRFICRNPR